MKFTSILTFVITILALTINPVFSGSRDESVPTIGFEINNFKIPSNSNLLAKSHLKYSIYKYKNALRICANEPYESKICGDFFEFDQDGQMYIQSQVSTTENNQPRYFYDVNLVKNKTNFITQVGQHISKSLYEFFTDVYIERETTEQYVKEVKEGVDITCLKVSFSAQVKYSCHFKLPLNAISK